MATVIDFRTRRAPMEPSPPPAVRAPDRREYDPPRTTPTNTRNRYDAAFKGYMVKRASALCGALGAAIDECDWRPLREGERKARIEWVIAEIEKMRDEALRTTPECHPPVATWGDDAELC